MFSSSNPFPSSIHGCPPASGIFSGEENDGVYLNNHPFFSQDYCSFDHPSSPPLVKDSGLINIDDHNDHQKVSDSVISHSRKRVAGVKKDRHSKIFTAQGPRDRRVRLSIDVSKKFFGLQDLLGFDKASKTLDWLFTRSKNAIKDLVEETKHTSSSTLSHKCEQVFMAETDFVVKNGRKTKPALTKSVNYGDKRSKKPTQKHKSGIHLNLVARRQLREEARSRARIRTLEKLRIKKLNNNDLKNVLEDRSYSYLLSSCENQIPSQSNHEVKIKESLTQEKLQCCITPSTTMLTQKIHQEDTVFFNLE